MNVLILAAGPPQSDLVYPIWLSEVDGQMVIERLVKALSLVENPNFVFAVRGQDVDDSHVDAILRQISPDASILEMRRPTAGAACTALLTIDHIRQDQELIVASATDHIDIDYEDVIAGFRKKGADVGVLTFDSLHPRYSFVRTDEEGWVTEAAEKRPISRQANAGLYWYARAGDFFDSLQQMILKDAHVGGVFYISPSLNELVLQGRRIATAKLEPEQYRPLKELRHLQSFAQQHDTRQNHAT